MAGISLSLSAAFFDAFGYQSEAFDFAKDVSGYQGSLGAGKATGDYGTPYYSTDANGREYYLPAWIEYSTGETLPDGTVTAGPVTKLELPHPVISIKSRKTIIETPLTERQDTVKEFINIAGWELTIRGLMINSSNEMPEALMKQLRDLYKRNSRVKLTCAMTDVFLNEGGNYIVIKDLAFPDVRGVKGVRPYEITAVSDSVFNLVDIS